MTPEPPDVLVELALPLAPEAGILEVLAIAVAVEDGYGVTIPDEFLTIEHLGSRRSIEDLLRTMGEAR